MLQKCFEIFSVAVIDTQIIMYVARGVVNISYGDLIEKYCHVKLAKKFQIFHWNARPLTEELCIYAINDVKYLIQAWYAIKSNIDYDSIRRASEKCKIDLCMKIYSLNHKPTASSYIQENNITINECEKELFEKL